MDLNPTTYPFRTNAPTYFYALQYTVAIETKRIMLEKRYKRKSNQEINFVFHHLT